MRLRRHVSGRRGTRRLRGVAGGLVVAAVVGAGSVLFGERILRMIAGVGRYVAGLFGAA